jgi:preprotein translocase subunit SecA|tara:strand:+ start:15832 stop:18408 length:2577 start_codon:yes stop_codon:yes gene_type:complete
LKWLTNLFGDSNDKLIEKMRITVDEINSKEQSFSNLSEIDLKNYTSKLKNSIKTKSLNIEDVLIEAFSLVREASKRSLNQRHFNVQLLGGITLHQGKIAEMKTGEGKTLVSTLATYLNALEEKGVHVITVNDYLAKRDAEWMGKIFDMLGLSVGVLQHEASFIYNSEDNDEKLKPVERKDAYNADITYGTNNEFGFDYLRDNMTNQSSLKVQRPLNFAIVDEVDNILIDEARTPLIISGPSSQSPNEYYKFAKIVPRLSIEKDYTIDEKHKNVSLTIEGTDQIEKILNIENLYAPDNFNLVHFVENALKANTLFQKDREYVINEGQIVLVDEFTGRLMHGRRYSDGLHQALEAKENLKVQRETITYATITLQNYFRMYPKLSGMTGTASTEAEEFWKIYKLEVIEIPTNKDMLRKDSSDLIFKDQKSKMQAILKEIKIRHEKMQPILIGTTDIEKSETISKSLKNIGIKHSVLNAKHHEKEASIIENAGQPGAVTVATNMAGRGTDIVLGGKDIDSKEEWEKLHNKVLELGGLHIIGTERHESRRIDNQLRGRAGRQGDPGSSSFYVAMDDELMRRFGGERIKTVMDWAGMDSSTPVENKMINRSIESAQTKVESQNFDIRKQLVEYDDVINAQREIIYKERNKVLDEEADLKLNINQIIFEKIEELISEFIPENHSPNWDPNDLINELNLIFNSFIKFEDKSLFISKQPNEIKSYLEAQIENAYTELENRLTPEILRQLEKSIMLQSIDSNWVQHLTNIDNLRQGIGLHAAGQRDPLIMYKKEAYEMFQNLEYKIRQDVAYAIFNVQLASKPSNQTINKNLNINNKTNNPLSKGLKLGRNSPCHCGSGIKYKRCHGS